MSSGREARLPAAIAPRRRRRAQEAPAPVGDKQKAHDRCAPTLRSVWFGRDLRLADKPALGAAARATAPYTGPFAGLAASGVASSSSSSNRIRISGSTAYTVRSGTASHASEVIGSEATSTAR